MTRKIATDFNVAPYYDDFDETKHFLRVLFNPAKPVQSRELTQMQTILNNQMSRLGNHIFKDGSVVIPGGFNIDTDVEYIKLDDTTIVPADWNGKIATTGSGAKFRVIISASKVSASEPSTLIGHYISGSTKFSGGDSLSNGDGDTATVQSSSFTGKSSIASVDEGIFYTSGFFARAPKQTIILDKYSNTPSYRVGLSVTESIIKSGDDSSLLDVAQGSPNASAPGADRFKIDLTLSKKNLDTGNEITNNASEDFYEFVRMVSGVRTDHVIYPQYSHMGDQLARRMYETNGNFSVKNFPLDVDTHNSDTAKLKLTVDPGKAYVLGYEVETIYPQFLDLDKARDTKSISSENISTYLGNYVYVNAVEQVGETNQVVDFKKQSLVDLLDSGNVKMGQARVRQLRRLSGGELVLNLFDIKLNSGRLITDFTHVAPVGITNETFTVTTPSRVNNVTSLSDAGLKSLILPVSKSSIKTTGDLKFQYSKYSTGTGSVTNTITITLESGIETFTVSDGAVTQAVAETLFVVLDKDTGKKLDVTGATVSSGSEQVEISVTGSSGLNLSVFSVVQLTNPSARTKTKNTDGSIVLNSAQNLADLKTIGKWVSLGKSDVIKVKTIKMSDDTDVTSRYEFDTGQRDTHYEHGRIRLKPGQQAPLEDTSITVEFDYFTHSSANGGYFDVDSYASINYADIPEYEDSTGKIHKLSDVLDFRPVYPDAGDIIDNKTPLGDADQFLEVDYDYYVPRIDKLVLTKEREFKVIKGIPSEFPTSPQDDKNSMTLYVLTVPPYTFSPNEVSVKPVQNRRYTMKDISLLERRLESLESGDVSDSIQSKSRNLSIRDDAGAEILKNGILVDDFSGHSVGDINDPDYSCSIDFETGEMRPAFESNNHQFSLNTDNSTNIKKTGPLVTAGYSSQTFLEQPLASTTTKVNPHDMVDWFGDLTLSPNSDTWFSKTLDPRVSINFAGENDAWEVLALSSISGIGKGFGTQWNDWQSIWTGVDLDQSDDEYNPIAIRLTKTELLGKRETDNNLTDSTKLNSITRFLPNRMDRDLVGNKLDISVVPYMRSQTITLIGRNLKPNTRVYGYFDDKDVTSDITVSTELILSSVVGTFKDDLDEWETVTDTTTGATGKVLLVTSDTSNVVTLYVGSVSGTFTATNSIIGSTSGATATIDTVTLPANLTTDSYGNVTGTMLVPETENSKIRSGTRLFRLTDESTNDVSASTTIAENQFIAQGTVSDPEEFVISTRLPKIKRTSLSDDKSVARDIFLRESSTISKNLKWKDPLAQNFIVDRAKYRNGIMLESLDLYFKTKDDNLPVSIEIRPTVNGFPSTGLIVPFSEVTKLPSGVTTNVGPDLTKGTNFKFQAPVYLSPGTYSIIVKSNSSSYELHTGEYGIPTLKSDGVVEINNPKVSKLPNVGAIFSSHNAGLWEPNLNKSLMFKLNSCKFTTTASTAEFDIKSLSSGTEEYSTFKLTNTTLDNFFNSTNISHKYKATVKGGSIDTSWSSVESNKNVEEGRILELSTGTNFKVQSSFTTSDENISPILDLERMSLITIRNIIDDMKLADSDITIEDGGTLYDGADTFAVNDGSTDVVTGTLTVDGSGVITGASITNNGKNLNKSMTVNLTTGTGSGATLTVAHEELSSGGISDTKYISKRIKLDSDKFAKDLRVHLDAYKPTGTEIFVYYKVHNSSSDESFNDQPWQPLSQITASYTRSTFQNDYKELVFGTGASTGAKPAGFDDFDMFSIKIVMSSNNVFTVPKVRNLKTFALNTTVVTA